MTKLFTAYHDDFINRIRDPEKFLEEDLKNKKTSVFAKFILRDNREYTLGQMSWIMMLIKPDGKTLQQSKLLRDFRNFVLAYFEDEILDNEYQNQIETIQKNFRNKAAHPYLLDSALAQQCQKLVRRAIKQFLENYLG